MKARASKGFTLVELMVAMVIGLVLMAGVVTLFVSSRHSFDVDGNVARMQDEARYAMQEMARDLSMASYLAEPLVPGSIMHDGTLAVDQECGPVAAATPNWMYQLVDGGTGDYDTLLALDNVDGADAEAAFACIDSAEVLAGNDVVSVKRVAGNALEDDDLVDGAAYLRSNGTTGFMFVEPPDMAVAGPWTTWSYLPRIYYVRNFSDEPGDGVPSLCRKTLVAGTPPELTTECIARGVEQLQVEYGLDSDADGNANRYVADPPPEEVTNIVSARVYLLVRTPEEDQKYVDDRTYTLGNAADYVPGADADLRHYHRRVYSVTVTVHNLRNLRRLGV